MNPWKTGLLLSLLAFAGAASAADNPDAIRLAQRLATLQADPDQADLAMLERLQARQAVEALAKAKRKDQPEALYLAERRVEIAEVAVRTAAARRELDRLDRSLAELRVEVSRRDAERARAEAERLRLQLQLQAEEAERLRQAAEAEAQARTEVEDSLNQLAGQQTARIDAAVRKEAQLARQEAELVSGAKLPASRFESRGEVFTLAAAVFEAKAPRLTASGKDSAKALAAYLDAVPKAKARIIGYGDAQTNGQRRAEAVRDALVAAGVARARLQVANGGSGTRAKAAEVVVSR